MSEGRAMTIAFRVVALLGGLLFTLPNFWFNVQSLGDLDGQAIHVVHNAAGFVGFTMLAGIPMLLLAWRPRQVALLRLVVATSIATVIGGLLGGVLMTTLLLGPVVTVVLLALSAGRAEVFRFGSPHLLLLAVAFIGAIPAVVEGLQQADLQGGRTSGDEHLEFFHYAGMTITHLALVLCAAWSAFPGRAVRSARLLTGFAGAAMALTFAAYPDAVSSIDAIWAVALLLFSIVYIALGEVAARAASGTVAA